MIYAQQIAEFHEGKGLIGKQLRRAVLNDTIRAKHYHHNWKRKYGDHNFGGGPRLSGAFSWGLSPEGVSYWAARDIHLRG
jgi:hypothetical protein